jgi:large subunit ribosomal protein L25
MAQQATLQADTRKDAGKGAARTHRKGGRVPAVIYGHDRAAETLTIDSAALSRLLSSTSVATTILDVTIDGRAPVKALIREIQRHPLRATDILHLDLYEVKADEKITVEVPIHLVGTADGVRNHGGVMDQVMHKIEIRVFPADIPEHVDVDVTNVAIGHSIFVRDITVPKADILSLADLPICSVVAPRAEIVATPEAVAETPAEPELIRKPKAEDEEGEEAGAKGEKKEKE